MGIELYCGVNETIWNHHPVSPGKLACVSPVCGASERTKKENTVKLPKDTIVLQDSGAFCDGPQSRLSFFDALNRQIQHAKKYKYTEQISHVASYDLLIDEKWIGEYRIKKRWSKEDARVAVEETIAAAKYISQNRHTIPNNPSLVLSAQGVSVNQYVDCVNEICPMLQDGDKLGLGGWCITGKMPAKILPSFYLIMEQVIPLAKKWGVKSIHIWGVIYSHALGPLLYLCNQNGINLSTDSAGPQVRPAAFGTWGYAEWKDSKYKIHPVETRGQEREKHVIQTRKWLSEFEKTKWYKPPQEFKYYPKQGRLF